MNSTLFNLLSVWILFPNFRKSTYLSIQKPFIFCSKETSEKHAWLCGEVIFHGNSKLQKSVLQTVELLSFTLKCTASLTRSHCSKTEPI